MPIITKISVQKKLKHRYNIFLKENENDKEYYGFSIDEDLLISYHLHKGQQLNQDQLTQIQEKDTSYKVYTQSLKYLSYRMRSKQELIKYLQSKEMEMSYIDEVITRLEREGLLDDLAFSEALVRTRMETSSKGPLLIKKELMDKGIAPNYIEQALSHFTYEKQLDKLHKLYEKKMNRTSKKSYKQQLDTAVQSLIQKGYTMEVIKEMLSQINTDKDMDEEKTALYHQGEKFLHKYKRKKTGFELEQAIKAALYRKGFDQELIQQFIEEYVKNDG
ncbi:recombination regulator RecX [Gracilibacillus marinus]|jgi:regulatory protein|uniref:Regulatory protein RecX n=1 Tax=Gracilibacillus marinus TaxID=630535 RepID=A0ABV8VY75_9BACI